MNNGIVEPIDVPGPPTMKRPSINVGLILSIVNFTVVEDRSLAMAMPGSSACSNYINSGARKHLAVRASHSIG